MLRSKSRPSLPVVTAAALVAAATFAGGCVVAARPGHVAVRPPVAVAVHLVRPGWDYVQVRGVWYYAPHGTRHFRHNYYVLRGGAWVFIR